MQQPPAHNYSVVRRLGSGRHADVVLASRRGSGTDDEHDDTSNSIVLKRRRENDDISTLNEAEILERARGDHVVRLIDVGTDETGRLELHLERVVGPSLTHLCTQRGPLTAGECVTVLAPIAATIQRLHAQGITHGGIRADSILFDDRMSPVLVGFGRSEYHPDASSDEIDERLSEDRSGFRQLAEWLLAQNPSCHGVADQVHDLEGETVLKETSRLLFEMATPTAVSLHPAPLGQTTPSRLIIGEPPAIETPRDWAWLLPEPIVSRVQAEAERAAALWSVVRRACRTVTLRWWVVGALGVGAGVVALSLTLSGEGTSPTHTVEEVPPPVSSPSSTGDSSRVPAVDPSHASVLGDDPIAALIVLAEARTECLRELSTLCLDDVDHIGSSALRMDVSMISAIRDRGAVPDVPVIGSDSVVLIERWGDSALLGVQQKDPEGDYLEVLLMRTGDGWRIRDYPDAWSVSSD